MLTPAEADAAIAAVLEPIPHEDLPISAAAGRILRTEIRAERDAPPFDRVTMDGIALDYRDGRRRSYRVAGIQPAGTPPRSLDSSADCFEVMTGAVLPRGCDTVAPVERVRIADGQARIDESYEPRPWQHVHRRGADARAGATLLERGTRLGAPELAIAASAGCDRIAVSRLPRIAVISTGDELVEPGAPILEHQVRRSNAYALAGSLRLAGYAPASDQHLPDRRDLIERALGHALAHHDVIVLSGGVSAGRFDHVPSVLESLGVRMVFHGIAQRPGRPMWFGIHEPGRTVFALPGNPVSVLVCLTRYVIPALDRLCAASARQPATAVLGREVAFEAPLSCFLPVALGYDREGHAIAQPRPTGGSGDYIALGGTGGFVELPRGPAVHPEGLAVPYYRWTP